MSFQVAPDSVQSAAQNLSNIHSTLEDASASVAAPTTGVAAAAEDEVSAGVAALFNSFGQEYQVLSAQAQGFHAQFVNLLNAGAGAYLSTEVANAEQARASQVTAPVQGLLGAAASTSGGAAAAVASSVAAAQSAAFPILGRLGGGTVGSLLGGLGSGTPVGSLLGGLGGGTPVGSLLGGLGGGSLVSSINGVVTALENGSAFSLLSSPIGSGLQTLSRNIAALPGTLQSLGGSLAPGLLHAGASTGSTGGPYQTLFENTIANLQTLGTGISANPAPFLHQIITNATGYANTIAADFQYLIQNSPTVSIQTAAAAATGAAASGGNVVGPYQSLIGNTVANVQSLGNNWVNQTVPALLHAGTGYPQLIATSLESGNLLSVVAIPGQIGLGFSNVLQQLTVPPSLSVTSLTPSGASLALGIGLPELLAFDALGAQVNVSSAVTATNAQIFNAILAGNPLAAATALIDAPANIANGLLNGEETLSLSLPLPGFSVTANVPFTGLLVPLQPLTVTATVTGLPQFNTVTVTGPPVGGLVPALVDYMPEVLAESFTA